MQLEDEQRRAPMTCAGTTAHDDIARVPTFIIVLTDDERATGTTIGERARHVHTIQRPVILIQVRLNHVVLVETRIFERLDL